MLLPSRQTGSELLPEGSVRSASPCLWAGMQTSRFACKPRSVDCGPLWDCGRRGCCGADGVAGGRGRLAGGCGSRTGFAWQEADADLLGMSAVGIAVGSLSGLSSQISIRSGLHLCGRDWSTGRDVSTSRPSRIHTSTTVSARALSFAASHSSRSIGRLDARGAAQVGWGHTRLTFALDEA